MKYLLRFLIFTHRWVGVALCVVFMFWFPSGIGMMYWRFPEVTESDRLTHAPRLDPSKIVLSPEEAAEKAGVQANPTQLRLTSFDGRPVYRFGGRGGRARNGGSGGGGAKIIYADTGEEQTEAPPAMIDRIASAWAGRPLAESSKVSVEEPDQWTIAGQLRNLRPMYKYSWPDGQQVYLNGVTGEVVQYTTFASRIEAHLSAIPHWLYYTPLRKEQPVWIEFMIWSSIIGTMGALVGIVVAIWMYSPNRRYRLNGQPTGVPYKGQKRWHWILGMVFGVATVTWTFSGLMTLGPFPLVQRLTGTTRPERGEQQQQRAQESGQEQPPQQQASANTPKTNAQRGGDPVGEKKNGEEPRRGFGRGRQVPATTAPASPDNTGEGGGRFRGGRDGGQQGIAGALRGRVRMADFASVHPRDLLSRVPSLDVRQLEWTSFAGEPIFNASLSDGKSQLLALDGTPINGFDQQRVIEIVKGAVPEAKAMKIDVLDHYDLYYLDRRQQRPLPVIRVLMNDAEQTRYYVDAKSARVVTTYSNRNWMNRWLTSALHSLNFPFLYDHRPLWDIVVISFMLGGTALCITSLVLAWRTLGRKLKRLAASDMLPAEG